MNNELIVQALNKFLASGIKGSDIAGAYISGYICATNDYLSATADSADSETKKND